MLRYSGYRWPTRIFTRPPPLSAPSHAGKPSHFPQPLPRSMSSCSCRSLPIVPRMPAPRDDPAQREHGCVGGEEDELAAGGRELEAAIERPLEVGNYFDPVALEAAV